MNIVKKYRKEYLHIKTRREKVMYWLRNNASIEAQLIAWLFGFNIHNNFRDECTPDFSCCCNKIHTPFIKKLKYVFKYHCDFLIFMFHKNNYEEP